MSKRQRTDGGDEDEVVDEDEQQEVDLAEGEGVEDIEAMEEALTEADLIQKELDQVGGVGAARRASGGGEIVVGVAVVRSRAVQPRHAGGGHINSGAWAV